MTDRILGVVHVLGSHPRRGSRLLVTLALAAVLGTGCDDNPKPEPMPTQSSAPSPSPTPTKSESPEPPALPDAAKGTSAASAKAFARHYIDTVNYAARTGDVSTLNELGTADCQSCSAISNNIVRVYSEGGRIESEGWTLDIATLVPTTAPPRPAFDLGVTRSAQRVYRKPGAEPKRFDGGKQPMTMYLIRRGSEWQVHRLDLVS